MVPGYGPDPVRHLGQGDPAGMAKEYVFGPPARSWCTLAKELFWRIA